MNKLSKEFVLAFFAFLLFIATAAIYNLPEPESLNMRFGWEYGNIAESIAQGKGYANVFTPESGSTAWMPPLYVFLLAGIFQLFGIKTVGSMWAMFLIKYVALAFSVYVILLTAGKTGYGQFKYLLALLYLALIYFNRDAAFLSLHDDWLILSLACWMLYAFSVQASDPSKKIWLQVFLLAILLPLASPALTLSFVVVEAWIIMRTHTSTRRLIPYAFVFAILIISASIWTYRNYQEFNKLIPIKSNFWYDFYLANALDDDGLVTNETFAKYHLINKNNFQAQYLTEGEARFTEAHQSLSFDWMRRHPTQLLANIGRRVISAFIYSHYVEDIPHVDQETISVDDLELLREEQLIFIDDSFVAFWITTPLPRAKFEDRLQNIPLHDKTAVLQDWLDANTSLNTHKRDWKVVLKSLFLSIVPSLSILCGLLIEKVRRLPIFGIAVVLYFTYLTPYVLVSHYRRYQAPLIGLQSILIFLVISLILDHLISRYLPALKPKP